MSESVNGRGAKPQWRARWYLWDGGFLTMGPSVTAGMVPPHSHHAIQIVFGLEGPVGLREPEATWMRAPGLMISPNVPHQFDPMGGLVVLVFVDPESREGRWLLRSFDAPIVEIPGSKLETWIPELRSLWDDPPDGPTTASMIHSLVRSLCAGPAPAYRLDERIVRALEVIRGMDTNKIALEEVARAVFLSPSRFAHLFSSEVGIPFRRYVLWRRLTRALVAVGKGHTLSAAAYLCGFADSAHLTRTCVQMFGQPPSVLMQPGEFFEIPAPFELPFVVSRDVRAT